MVTYASAGGSTCFKEPNHLVGFQDPNRFVNSGKLVCQYGLAWGAGTSPRRMWEDIAMSVKKVFPDVEILSTINYESKIPSLIVTKNLSFYLRDIYHSWRKACFFSATNEADEESSRSEKHLNKESPNKAPRFAQEICSLISLQPVENGFTHPAEKILMEALANQEEDVIRWIESILEDKNPYLVASVISCLGRVTEKSHPAWAINIVGEALEHSNVAVRDAAAQVLESWETPQVLGLLSKHKEKVPWLQEYIGKIVIQLSSY
jgi:hypothetical protein